MNSLRDLANQAGTMDSALAYIADELHTALTHLDELGDMMAARQLGAELVGLADITSQLDHLATYVADVQARTAPAPAQLADQPTARSRPVVIEPHDEGTAYCTGLPEHGDLGHPFSTGQPAQLSPGAAALIDSIEADEQGDRLPADLRARVAAGTMPEYLAWMAAAVRDQPTRAPGG
jgi:hypothetical protein